MPPTSQQPFRRSVHASCGAGVARQTSISIHVPVHTGLYNYNFLPLPSPRNLFVLTDAFLFMPTPDVIHSSVKVISTSHAKEGIGVPGLFPPIAGPLGMGVGVGLCAIHSPRGMGHVPTCLRPPIAVPSIHRHPCWHDALGRIDLV